MIEIVASESELLKVLNAIDDVAKEVNIFLLQGNLAAGKTTLVKAYAKYLGYEGSVNSPTFSLMNIYDDRIHHYDLYNKELEGFLALGLLDELEKEAIHLIEWGDARLERVLKSSGFDFCKIVITPLDGKRIYRIERCIS